MGRPGLSYRGAEIRCAKGGQVCGLFMEGHPLHGRSFGAVGTVTPLVDLWVDIRGLPEHRASPWSQASDRRGPHTTSQDVTEPAVDVRSMTRTARPGTPSTRSVRPSRPGSTNHE